MKIQRLFLPAAAALLFAAGPAMAGDATAQTPAQPATRTIAVLVQVDDHGNIADMSPDIKLQPALNKLLRQTLDQMISKPAHDSHGKPIASQMVLQLSMDATQLPNGSYKAKFGYLSARAVPTGQWVWGHVHNGQKPVLVRQGAASNRSLANRQKRHQLMQASMRQAEQARARARAQQQQSGNSGNSGGTHPH